MAILGLGANTRFFVGDTQVDGVVEANEVGFELSFDDGSAQANLVIDNLTFVRDARALIKKHIADGLTGGVGATEGITFTVDAYNKNNERLLFTGFIDTSKALIDDSNARLQAPIVKADGINRLDSRLSAINFNVLDVEGLVTANDYQDIDYVVEANNTAFEVLVSSVLLFLMIKELTENIKDLAKDVATALGITSAALTGGIGATVFAIVAAVVQTAYTAAILQAVITLGKDLINTFVPPVRTHKALSFKRGLEVILSKLGYELETDIELLDKFYYLPSNDTPDSFDNRGFIQKVGTITKGIPKASDFGYSCQEFFLLARTIFNARYAIVGNKVLMYNRESDKLKKQSSYTAPDILAPAYRFNSEELIANRSFNFSTDVSDEYTITNYRGNSYQVNTSQKTVGLADNVTIEGFEDINFNLALATRKDKLNGLERILATVAKKIDQVTSVFGGGTNIAKSIKNKVGVMKVSNNYHRVPKIVYLENGRIPTNHRDILSAKAIYDRSYFQSSLANASFSGQKHVYEDVDLPFNFEDLLKVEGNAYFSDSGGNQARLKSLKGNLSTSKATASYEVDAVWTRNLKESYNEQG